MVLASEGFFINSSKLGYELNVLPFFLTKILSEQWIPLSISIRILIVL
jgi:hypothetical protein